MTTAADGNTILVADDDSDIREMLALVLEMRHHRVVDAADGLQAVATARATAGLSLILLDLMMPGMSGVEVMKTIKADPALAAIPVVVLSGDRRARETALALGAAGFLPKPIELADLLREVHRFVPAP